MGGMCFRRIGSRRTRRVAASALLLATLAPLGATADPLRLLPLGDSITWGWGSESTYGYRDPLAGLLTAADVDFEFVGSITDEYERAATTFIDPPIRKLFGSPPHYSIPGASADRLGQTNKASLLWSIRNDQDGDGFSDSAFASAGGLIPTLVNQGKAPNAILLHIGTNDMGFGQTAVTSNPGAYSDNAADSQLFRLLQGLQTDLSSNGLLTGSEDDTQVLLARIIPRPVDSRTKARSSGIDETVLQNTIAYNNAIAGVVASLSANMRNAITVVDMWDVDLTSPALTPNTFRDDGVFDQPFDTFTGGDAIFNEQGRMVGGVPVHEANPDGPDYADWLLRYDEHGQAFYDGVSGTTSKRWNQGLYGVQVGGEFYDAIHPNVNGYELMARVWFEGLFKSGNLTGDFNGSGQVEQGDLDLVLQNWGVNTAVSGVPAGWVNDNGDIGLVEQAELDVVLQHWGSTFAVPFGATTVPEPASLACFAAAGILVRRRRL